MNKQVIYGKEKNNMSYDLKPELSKKNKYFISREKYYELKHFCRQYDEWIKTLHEISPKITSGYKEYCAESSSSRPVEELVAIVEALQDKINLVDKTLFETDPNLAKWLKMTVTHGATYENLKLMHNIPYGRDDFYNHYRKFFYLLSLKR